MTPEFVYPTLFLIMVATVCLFGENVARAFSDNKQQISDEINLDLKAVCRTIKYSSCKGTNYAYLTCPPKTKGQNYAEYTCPILFQSEETFALCSNKSIASIDDIRIPANTTVLCLQDNPILEIGPGCFKQYAEIKHLNLQRCKDISKISENAFKGLDKLVWLSLDNITVPDIPNKTFSFLPKLMRLGLSFWNPEWQLVKQRKEQLKLNCLQGLNETQIYDIDLRGVNPESATGVFWELEAPLFSVFKQTNLKCLALMHNQIITVRENVLNNFHKLEYLWISHNLIMGTDKNVVLIDIPQMKNLKFADISHQNYVYLKFHHYPQSWIKSTHLDSQVKSRQLPGLGQLGKVLHPNITLTLPPKLKLIIAGYTRIVTRSQYLKGKVVLFNSSNDVEQICLQSLYMTGAGISQINIFKKLKVLNLKGAKFYVTNLRLFENLTSLEYLNLASFNLDHYLKNESEWDNFAEHLNMPNLTYLDMSKNYLKINKSSIGIFNKFPLLQSLNLGHNLFDIIPLNISNLTNLRYLGLQSNKFFTIPREVMNEWIHFGKSNPKNKLTINLSGVTLYCSCADIKIITDAKYIKNVKLEGFVCLFPSKEKLDLHKINITEMERRCGKNWMVSHMYIVYICYVFVMMAYVIPIICYRYRHSLMYMWYLYKYSIKKKVLMDMNESKYEYDAYFICHPGELANVGQLYKTLENVYGYKLYILERDGLGGNTLLNIIKHSFTLCRNAILVISEKSMKAQCFHYLVHLAKEISDTRNAKIVCILLNKKCILESPSVTGSLEYLLCTSLCLSWEAKHINKPVFWMKLRNHLGIPSQQ